jgi:hypothetical protein
VASSLGIPCSDDTYKLIKVHKPRVQNTLLTTFSAILLPSPSVYMLGQYFEMRFQVLTAASIKMTALWYIVPCTLVASRMFQRCVLPLSLV